MNKRTLYTPDNHRPAEFLTEFRALDVTEGRETQRLRMLEPFRAYSAILEDEVEMSAGFEFDGESIPPGLQWLAPPFGQSKRGAGLHDWLYRHGGYYRCTGEFVPVSRKTADAVYREMVQVKGLPKWRAHLRWSVLRLVGWTAWNSNRKNDPYATNFPS